jgi:hypothetical protein
MRQSLYLIESVSKTVRYCCPIQNRQLKLKLTKRIDYDFIEHILGKLNRTTVSGHL